MSAQKLVVSIGSFVLSVSMHTHLGIRKRSWQTEKPHVGYWKSDEQYYSQNANVKLNWCNRALMNILKPETHARGILTVFNSGDMVLLLSLPYISIFCALEGGHCCIPHPLQNLFILAYWRQADTMLALHYMHCNEAEQLSSISFPHETTSSVSLVVFADDHTKRATESI